MSLSDEIRIANQSAKTHEAICQSLILENKKYRAVLVRIAAGMLTWQEMRTIASEVVEDKTSG
jgi:hypothetical protein